MLSSPRGVPPIDAITLAIELLGTKPQSADPLATIFEPHAKRLANPLVL